MQERGRSARVLWVTEEPPSRSLGGGNIRQSHLFRALASVVPTDLLVAGPVPDEGARAFASELIELPARSIPQSHHPLARRALDLAIILGSRYPSALYHARSNRQALADAIREREDRYDLVCVEHEALAPLLPRAKTAKWLITFHHLLSSMIAEELRLAPGRRQLWFRARDLGKARRLERWALRAYDRCIVCSDQDAARLSSRDAQASDRVAVIPNGVDLKALLPTPVPRSPRVLLPGTLAWPPNVDAAVWFCTEVWPQVRAVLPEATLVLAGRSPAPEVTQLGRLAGVSVEADVPAMGPYFESARVVVVPLRIGTGTRIKALEAMAAGRPVIGTHIGLEGIGVEDTVHARLADDAQSFAAAVIEILRSDVHAEALARAARQHAEGYFDWERIGDDFVRLISALLDGTAPARTVLRSSSNSA